ncbi:DUF1624 domain-containing protein [Corynebacterium pseudotuberculosis]|uniref:heparan-alpha-glucosaminide N-acetyltransferase domain-containing protein n=1 Tax=Corynebacterium pseudotuberculosis TaxID=1719 RepID=UPI0006BB6F59|nr:heparan-alpha-glucosaminide N-acetyltransferase domain-containing protein [Corynebacterium pseudotuberculosis]ALF57120.1 hypothetical protein AN902_02815 [Corynebacterium pseudotuberculosis]ANH25389.1 Hypothetical protein CpMEX9_0582 [Corynebacterium pseudotuberculosis]APZ31341.1 Hypothetical protein CpMEX1_0581 [Corynebacterium pseudotuberculosis]QGX58699.1 DUF1624 domain-containing protein [Corynebacterium pseudotuberculosis]
MTSQISTQHHTSDAITRPQPGPACVRPIWNGEAEVLPQPYSPPPEPEIRPSRWNKELAFGSSADPRRIIGIDSARGFALIGMIAVHVLPAYNKYTDQPTLIWQLFGGNSSALFALLAGVTIALLTGGNMPHSGRELRRDQISLAVRAVIVFALGLALDEIRLPVSNILAYYGLLFLLSIALVSLRIRTLFILSGVFIIAGPLAIFAVNSWGHYTTTLNPSFSSLINLPVDTIITLFVGGTYPVVTWMAYICVGIALGRMNLHWLITQTRLIAIGAVAAIMGFLLSTFLIDYVGGFSQLYYHTDNYDVEDILRVIDFGPEIHLPTDTWWWLAINGPHVNTPFSLLTSLGSAILALGSFLVITRMIKNLFIPLIAAGSMTLTLYVSHILLMATFKESTEALPTLWFMVHVLGALLFGTAWQLARGRGPLEEVVSKISKRVSRAFLPAQPKTVSDTEN